MIFFTSDLLVDIPDLDVDAASSEQIDPDNLYNVDPESEILSSDDGATVPESDLPVDDVLPSGEAALLSDSTDSGTTLSHISTTLDLIFIVLLFWCGYSILRSFRSFLVRGVKL